MKQHNVLFEMSYANEDRRHNELCCDVTLSKYVLFIPGNIFHCVQINASLRIVEVFCVFKESLDAHIMLFYLIKRSPVT